MKNETIHIKVSEKFLKRLDYQADKRGLNRSQFARIAIENEITQVKENFLNKSKSKQIAQMIYADISDRRGLRQELEMIDEDTKEEMINTWEEIINQKKDK